VLKCFLEALLRYVEVPDGKEADEIDRDRRNVRKRSNISNSVEEIGPSKSIDSLKPLPSALLESLLQV